MNIPARLVFSILIFSASTTALPKDWFVWFHSDACKNPHRVTRNITGEVIEGSTCVETPVNALRYSTQVVQQITESAGKDLTGIFQTSQTPKIGDAQTNGSNDNSKPLTKELTDLQNKSVDEQFKKIQGEIIRIQNTLFNQQQQVRDVKAAEALEIQDLKDILASSDRMLEGRDYDTLVRNLIDQSKSESLILEKRHGLTLIQLWIELHLHENPWMV